MNSPAREAEAQRAAMVNLARRMMTATPEQRVEVMKLLDKSTVIELLKFMMKSMPEDRRAQASAVISQIHKTWKPEDDDGLWRFIADEIELKIPRNAVCEGHCAPFDFVADAYFERGIMDKLIIGNRGSGKTQLSGMMHGINARFKPKIEAVSAGAIENQAKKCYDYFKKTVILWKDFYNKRDVKIRESNFPNGSKVEVVIGTMSGVNSPHPHVAHLDEIELLRPGVFEESANMAQSKTMTINGEEVTYRAQNWLTSSWKKPRGLVTQLFDEISEANRAGRRAPYQVYRWCVFETTQPCPHDCSVCPFSEMIKDKWTNGEDRTFEQVCKQGSRVPGEGRLKRSDGFIPLEDTLGKFMRLGRRVWEAQQESKRPTAEGLVYEVFDEDIHGIEGWSPDLQWGPIDLGLDFGGKNPFAALFFQVLDVQVNWCNLHGANKCVCRDVKKLPEGAVIIFDEVYQAQIGNVTFGLMINDRIIHWDQEFPGFAQCITGIYRDPAAKAAAIDLKQLNNHGQGDPRYRSIPTQALGGVEVDVSIAHVEEQITDGYLYLDTNRCPETLNEFLSYEYPDGKNAGQPVKENDHAMDAMRYRMWNAHLRQGRGARGIPGAGYGGHTGMAAPKASPRRHATPMGGLTTAGSAGVSSPHKPPVTPNDQSAKVVEQAGAVQRIPHEVAMPRVSQQIRPRRF